MLAVETHQLSKQYGQQHSLKDCCLAVPTGITFGLLGPNGAGKSTLIRILLGFLRPTSGRAEIFGKDVHADFVRTRRDTSYLPGDARLYRAMRGNAVLEMFSGLHPHGNLRRSQAVAERLDLELERRVMFMSTGMRQKLALAITLGCQAPLVILDEPTANLDPNVRAIVLELIREVKQAGRTVLISSHIFSDIDTVCDEVAILRKGELVARQSMQELTKHHVVQGKAIDSEAAPQLLSTLKAFEFCDWAQTRQIENHLSIRMHLQGDPQRWMPWLSRLAIENMTIQRAGIQAVYERYHGIQEEASETPADEFSAGSAS